MGTDGPTGLPHWLVCYALAVAILDDSAAAADIVVDVLTAARAAAPDPTEATVLAAIHRAAVATLRHRRSGAGEPKIPALAEMLLAAGPAPGSAGSLERQLDRLTPQERQTLVLAYFGGCRPAEITRVSGTPRVRVPPLLAAAVRRLRR